MYLTQIYFFHWQLLVFSHCLNINLLRVYYKENIANGQRKKLKNAFHAYIFCIKNTIGTTDHEPDWKNTHVFDRHFGILLLYYTTARSLVSYSKGKIKRSNNNISVFYNWNLKTQMTAAFVTCLFQLDSWANHKQK